MSYKMTLLIAGLATVVAVPSLAREHCTEAPRSDWKPVHEISAHATNLGYSVFGVEREGSCYEVKGLDKHGARIKVFYDPQTGEPMRRGHHR